MPSSYDMDSQIAVTLTETEQFWEFCLNIAGKSNEETLAINVKKTKIYLTFASSVKL